MSAILFLFAGTGRVSAQISFSAKEPTIGQIIESVKSQSKYQFFYDSNLSGMKTNPVDMSGVSLDSLLSEAFKGRNVAYKIEDNICYLSATGRQQPPSADAERIVTGRVIDTEGGGIIGVTVTVPGTGIGVVTDFEGKYSIRVPANATRLNFSYIGFEVREENIGTRAVINVTMQESSITVNAVVVTAMGIERETKSLTYNVQSVSSNEITTVKDANLMNSLAGKIAGVTINQSSSGTGGSTRVVMRGTKSLFGDNNALYVLDGIPLSSLKTRQSDNFYEVDRQGDSEGITNINPDDIESMSVLTGAAAAALYGNRGSNGVILITTKKGVTQGTRINYSNNTTFSSPFVMPQFQNTYGQQGEGYSSWGAKLESPSSYRPRDFFQTGANTMNTVSVSTGNQTHQLRASLGSVNARGIIPNNKYNRYNFSALSSSQLSKVRERLTLDLSVNYVDQNDQNMVGQGLYYNPLVAIYLFPPGDDIDRFLPYGMWNPERNFHTQNWSYGSDPLEGVRQNPFWTANRNLFLNKRDRTILSGALTYKPLDWLDVSFRARMDRANSGFERKLYASTDIIFAHKDTGFYADYTLDNRNLYADFLVSADKTFCRDWRVTANVGGSFNDEQSVYDGYEGMLMTVPDFFHPSNVTVEVRDRIQDHTRTNSLYATGQLAWRSMFFLDIAGRIDYFSTLAGYDIPGRNVNDRNHNNPQVWVFYPSIGGSVLLSEVFKMNANTVPLWKIRASYSHVGNPPPSKLTGNYVRVVNGALMPSALPPNLTPEKTKAFEVGTDIIVLKNKLNVAFTYYNTDTYHQLFQYNLPPTTGYPSTRANAGRVNNRGIELSAAVNQKIGPVEWNGRIAYSMNRNKIVELLPFEMPDPLGSGEMIQTPREYEVANAGGAYIMKLTEGGSMSDIYVNSFKRDHNGYILVNPATGRFEIDTNNPIKIGQAAPKYNMSMRNGFAWNGITLGFMVDARVGGVVVSSTQALMDQYGVSRASALAREKGGVPVNFGTIDPQTYYTTIAAGKNGAALSEYTYSATNVRLRELSMSYALPSKWFGDKLDVSVSVMGRNLWMFYNKAPFDPELTANTGTYYQGYDYFMPPSVRTLGFGINMTF